MQKSASRPATSIDTLSHLRPNSLGSYIFRVLVKKKPNKYQFMNYLWFDPTKFTYSAQVNMKVHHVPLLKTKSSQINRSIVNHLYHL